MTELVQAKYRTTDAVDFVIIGSGAAGGVLAKELSTNGFRVVVLEQGPFLHESDFSHDEYKQSTFGPLVNHNQKQSFRKTEQEEAKPGYHLMYGKVVGGGSVHFTGNYWRLARNRLHRSAAKKGTIAGTGFADWPITYADLEPYYTKVDWEIGVSGEAGSNPFDPLALQAVSASAHAGEILGRAFRTRRPQTRLASLSCSRRHPVSALQRTQRLHALWLLRTLRM